MKKLMFCLNLMIASVVFAAEQVPFGSEISEKVFRYHRHTPFIATSGNFQEGAIAELVGHGFKTIIDLRTAVEGISKDQSAAIDAGLQYISMPVGRDFPDAQFFEKFALLVDDSTQYPMLVRCASASRVGMVWAAHRIQRGATYEQALLEARTIGIRPATEKKLLGFWKKRSNK